MNLFLLLYFPPNFFSSFLRVCKAAKLFKIVLIAWTCVDFFATSLWRETKHGIKLFKANRVGRNHSTWKLIPSSPDDLNLLSVWTTTLKPTSLFHLQSTRIYGYCTCYLYVTFRSLARRKKIPIKTSFGGLCRYFRLRLLFVSFNGHDISKA